MNRLKNYLKMGEWEQTSYYSVICFQSKPGEVQEAVKHAIDVGYRHFDCARFYENEAEIGEAIREKIKEGVVKREDVFVTSKLWCTNMRPDLVEPTLRKTLADLGLDYLDLYLIHWPCAFKEGDNLMPEDPNNEGKVLFSDVDYVDTWKAMENVYNKGLVKTIGISNFNKKQVTRLLENAKVVPAVNQIECHPYLNQKKLTEFCKSKGIHITPDRPWAKPTDPVLTEEPIIKGIAGKHGKTPAQVIFRYIIQLGVVPIPKSTNKSRLAENINVFDFELTSDEMAKMDTLDYNGRTHCLTL
nr:unnamed protein product [Callosobruchus chinensis]